MTEKQKIFCDEYLIDLNATRAYKAAYPSCKRDNSAAVNSNRLLRKANVKQYIEKRLAEKDSALIAKQDEVLKSLTRVMRREEAETVVVTCKNHKSYYDDSGKKVVDDSEVPVTVAIPTKVSDANKAAELLGRYYTLFNDKINIDGDLDFSIKVDYGDEENNG